MATWGGGTIEDSATNGILRTVGHGYSAGTMVVDGYGSDWMIDASWAVPTAAKNQPRAWGSLACVYLSAPK